MVAAAEAFRPSGRVSSGMQLSMKKATSGFEEEIGALPPVGFWDPLGLAADGDKAVFDRRRASELKHGRIAMLAVVGYLVQDVYRLPGAIDLDGTTFDSIPNGVAAIGAVSSLGWLQIVGSIGYWELIGWEDKKGEEVGDFGFYIGAGPQGAQLRDYRTKEVQNGRLAMLAIMEVSLKSVLFSLVLFSPPPANLADPLPPSPLSPPSAAHARRGQACRRGPLRPPPPVRFG